jgi:hypothetical protein
MPDWIGKNIMALLHVCIPCLDPLTNLVYGVLHPSKKIRNFPINAKSVKNTTVATKNFGHFFQWHLPILGILWLSKGLKRLLLMVTLLLKKDFKLKCFVLETGLRRVGFLQWRDCNILKIPCVVFASPRLRSKDTRIIYKEDHISQKFLSRPWKNNGPLTYVPASYKSETWGRFCWAKLNQWMHSSTPPPNLEIIW